MTARITEAEIRDLVFTFYDRVRQDARLGPVFDRTLQGRWEPHLEKMCDFWSGVLLATGRFRGNPVQAHMEVPDIRPAHFERWLELFEITAFETLRPHNAVDVVGRAARMRVVLERAACPSATAPDDARVPARD
jgi:hemoglobin